MSIRTLRAAALAVLLVGLTACTFSRYDLPGQVNSFNGSLELLQEQAILVNILRASEGAPMGFTAVTQVLSSGAVTYALGLPTVGIGGGPQGSTTNRFVFGGNGLGNGVSGGPNTNFNLLPLETKEFWLGMLTPLSADTLAFFINQGVSRELLFYLYLQRVEFSAAGKPPEVDFNNPLDPRFSDFSKGLHAAIDLGLTAQTASHTLDFGPPLPASQATDVNNLLNIAKAGLNIVPVASANGTTYQLKATRSAAVICFDQARASVDISGRVPASVNCSGGAAPAAGAGTPFAYQDTSERNPIMIQFYPRSTYDVFRYLGAVVRAGRRQAGPDVALITEESRSFSSGEPVANRLFYLQKNGSGPSFVSVKYGPDTYSIPKNATTTIEVMALLRQLVALSTSVNSLPPTGTLTTVVH